MARFHVETPLFTAEVTTSSDAVTVIRLGVSGTESPATPFDAQVAEELTAYANGDRTDFSFAIRTAGTPFQERTWAALRAIPYGEVRTYAEVAAAIGQPGASRAVGSANNSNRLPIVIPCHRVIAAHGQLGGFGGGVEVKRRLLALEGTWPPGDQQDLFGDDQTG